MTTPANRKTVLIVDDQVSLREMLSEMLGNADYATLAAENGAEAVAMTAEHRPDLVIMDLMMPVKNGLEAAREIRLLPGMNELPILFLTARGNEKDEEMARAAGGTDFIRKPFSPRQVLATIQAILK